MLLSILGGLCIIFASAGLLTYIAISKYADALPLYRRISILELSGITLDRTSLANWMINCDDLVQSVINRLLYHLRYTWTNSRAGIRRTWQKSLEQKLHVGCQRLLTKCATRCIISLLANTKW